MEDQEASELRHYGYPQQLRRSVEAVSSFAAALPRILVFTGLFANFDHGLRERKLAREL